MNGMQAEASSESIVISLQWNTRACPVVTDVAARVSAVGADVTPGALPDLHRGEPLVIAARIPHDGRDPGGEIEITGSFGARPWRVLLPVARAAEGKGLSKLWARRRIADAEVARTLREITPLAFNALRFAIAAAVMPVLNALSSFSLVSLASSTNEASVMAELLTLICSRFGAILLFRLTVNLQSPLNSTASCRTITQSTVRLRRLRVRFRPAMLTMTYWYRGSPAPMICSTARMTRQSYG